MGEKIEPYVLRSTPAVMSVGARCMECGYTFLWPAGQPPYFILPDGRLVICEVRGNIPYIVPGAPECQPYRRGVGGRSSSVCPKCGCDSGRKFAFPGVSSSSGDPMPPWGVMRARRRTRQTRRLSRMPRSRTVSWPAPPVVRCGRRHGHSSIS